MEKYLKQIEKTLIISLVLIFVIFCVKITYLQFVEQKVKLSYKTKEIIKPNTVLNKKNKTIKLTVKKKKININRDFVETLKTLKGIGEKTAKNIVDYRKRNGSFKTKKSLLKVKGIGKKKFNKIKDDIEI